MGGHVDSNFCILSEIGKMFGGDPDGGSRIGTISIDVNNSSARLTFAVNIHKAVRSTSSMFRTTSTVHFPPFPLAGNLSASLCCPYFGSMTEVSKPNENSVVELEHILRVNKCGTMVCELFLQKKLFTPFLF